MLKRSLLIVALALMLGGLQVSPVHAAPQTLTVTDCSNEFGPGTLGDAIATAASDSGDTITFSCSGTISLTSTLTISSDLTIDGSGHSIVIDGNDSVQIFFVDSGVNFSLNHLTLSHGYKSCSDNTCFSEGGAIDNSGTLTVTNSTLSDNTAECSSDGCRAYAGAIYNNGTLSITNSTLSGNIAECSSNCIAYAGAIYNYGTATITNSTFSGDTAKCSSNYCGAYGGAIYNYDGSLTITNSTLSDNTAECSGIACNAEGGALFNTGTPYLGATILSSNSPQSCDQYALNTDWGYNDSPDGTCLNGGTGDTTADPLLAPLGNYGGPTQTMALLPGSPAIDQIPLNYTYPNSGDNLCPANGTDQRGYPRPDVNETSCDIGAYETQDDAYGPTTGPAYDIESSNFSCSGGGSACVPLTGNAGACSLTFSCPNLSYGDVEAFGRPNNSSSGTPDELILFCSKQTASTYTYGYLDVVSHQGSLDYPAGTRSAPGIYGLADLGSITGQGTLIGGGGSEDNPSQRSSLSASAYDLARSIHGTVSGVQNTDNNADTLNSGGFTVTLSGTLHRVAVTGNTPTMSSYQGTISCQVGGSQGLALAQAGKDTAALAEGELEPLLGDNLYLPVMLTYLNSLPSS